nr:hypothetical protein [uncultured Campylobacter sp.]
MRLNLNPFAQPAKKREFDGMAAPNPANLIKFRGILANLYRTA